MSTNKQWNISEDRSSAAQPAEYLSQDPSSAAQPAPGKEEHFCRLAFYNIGWQLNDKKRTVPTLAKFLNTIRQEKNVHAFGICEVFNIKDDDEKPRREEIMKTLLTNLNESEGRDAWTGKALSLIHI